MADAMAGAAQGAAAGAVFGPWGAAIGAVAGALLAEDSKAQSGGATQAAPGGTTSSAAAKATYGSHTLNADGWSVNFSGTQTNTPVFNKDFSATGPTASSSATSAREGGYAAGAPAGGGLSLPALPGGVPWLAVGIVGAALLWKSLKK